MSATRRSRLARASSWVLVSLLLGFVVFALAWRLDGGRWQRVETPSMGTVAPVGTLLWVKPTEFAELGPGDFVSFHPPGRDDLTYSHLVHEVHADGTITTKGVIPGPDPWRLDAGDVVGEVRMRWWGVGWLVTAAPVLLPGILLVVAVSAVVRTRWKLPARILLGSLVATVAIVTYRPFVGAEQIAFTQTEAGGGRATYVGTGLLPIRLQAHNGGHVDLRAGEVGTVVVPKPDPDHRLRVSLGPAVPAWWWIVMVLACFLPALYALVVGLEPLPAGEAARRQPRVASLESGGGFLSDRGRPRPAGRRSRAHARPGPARRPRPRRTAAGGARGV